jgi:hypothetical protein
MELSNYQKIVLVAFIENSIQETLMKAKQQNIIDIFAVDYINGLMYNVLTEVEEILQIDFSAFYSEGSPLL